MSPALFSPLLSLRVQSCKGKSPWPALINSSLQLYAKPEQSSAKGSRTDIQQDMFSFTPNRNTIPILNHTSVQPLDGSVTFQDDKLIWYVLHPDIWNPLKTPLDEALSEPLTDSYCIMQYKK